MPSCQEDCCGGLVFLHGDGQGRVVVITYGTLDEMSVLGSCSDEVKA